MDKQFLYDLMDEFEKRDIHELFFENKNGSIRLTKAARPAHVVTQVPPAVAADSASVLTPPSVAAGTSPEVGGGAAAVSAGAEIIAAPMVGNFYRQPAPDAPYFVNEGQQVKKGQTICILEAMKLMNELPAEFDCEIVKALVKNGVMVEAGTPLFEVKRV